MTCNIDSWKQTGGEPLRISKEGAQDLEERLGDDAPECWFPEDLSFGEDGYSDVPELLMYGSYSGTFYREYIDQIAERLEGEADFVITWEGGDVSGLRISGGKAIEMDVAFSLVERAE